MPLLPVFFVEKWFYVNLGTYTITCHLNSIVELSFGGKFDIVLLNLSNEIDKLKLKLKVEVEVEG
jgi:hypothetical protein